MEETNPKVFISYSHGSDDYQKQVLDFANHLRDDGVDAEIDQFEEAPSEGWPRWMEKQIQWADFVIILVSKSYLDKFENNTGKGVDWEVNIIYNMLYNTNAETKKFIPAYFDSDDAQYIPTSLQGYTRYNIEEEYNKLYNRLRGITSVKKHQLGKLKPLTQRQPKSVFYTSPINLEKWDRAHWNGMLYFLPTEASPDYFPILGLTFENFDAGVEIFKEWHDNWGKGYADDYIAMSYIVPPFPEDSYAFKNHKETNFKGYYVSIEPNVDEAIKRAQNAGLDLENLMLTTVSRNTWVDELRGNHYRKMFEEQLKITGKFGLIAAHIKEFDSVAKGKILTENDVERDMRHMILLRNFKEKRGIDLSDNDISTSVLRKPTSL